MIIIFLGPLTFAKVRAIGKDCVNTWEQSLQNKSGWPLGKYLSLASVKYLNERALTSIERDLDTVAHEEIEETGSETAELSNGGKSA